MDLFMDNLAFASLSCVWLTSKGGLIGSTLACSPRDPSSNPAFG